MFTGSAFRAGVCWCRSVRPRRQRLGDPAGPSPGPWASVGVRRATRPSVPQR